MGVSFGVREQVAPEARVIGLPQAAPGRPRPSEVDQVVSGRPG